MTNPKELGLAEAAQALRQSWAATWQDVLRGNLKARKVGNRWHVDADDLRRLARERSQLQTA